MTRTRTVVLLDDEGELLADLEHLFELVDACQPNPDDPDDDGSPAPAGLGPVELAALRRVTNTVAAALRSSGVQLHSPAGADHGIAWATSLDATDLDHARRTVPALDLGVTGRSEDYVAELAADIGGTYYGQRRPHDATPAAHFAAAARRALDVLTLDDADVALVADPIRQALATPPAGDARAVTLDADAEAAFARHVRRVAALRGNRLDAALEAFTYLG